MIELLFFISWLIDLVIFIVIAGAILSWLLVLNIINRHNNIVFTIADTLNRITEPFLRPIRRRLPNYNGVDLSPMVLIIGLYFVKWVVLPNLARLFQ
jgi:YggT family protein